MTHGPYTIGIDCRLSGSTHAGIGRYIENLVVRLPFNQEQYRWVLFFYHNAQLPTDPAFTKAVEQGKVKVVFAPVQHYSLAEQTQLPTIFGGHNLDLLHVPHFNVPLLMPNQPPLVVTIHDLLWHEHRGTGVTTLAPWKYWLKYLGYRFVTNSAVAKARAILVPSKAVQATVARYYPEAKAKTVVTYEGATAEVFEPSTKPATKVDQSEFNAKTLLYVGSLYPHKNVKVVLEALRQLSDYTLEIAGSRSVFRDSVADQAKELGVADQVSFLGFVPDHQLRHKYQSCLALVQPSLSEGFGLTGLEAMTAGGAVIASDIPVFQEIYQDGALYFDPQSAAAFVSAVHQLDAKRRTQLITQGKRVAAQYSWETMVEQTVKAYQSVLYHEKNS